MHSSQLQNKKNILLILLYSEIGKIKFNKKGELLNCANEVGQANDNTNQIDILNMPMQFKKRNNQFNSNNTLNIQLTKNNQKLASFSKSFKENKLENNKSVQIDV